LKRVVEPSQMDRLEYRELEVHLGNSPCFNVGVDLIAVPLRVKLGEKALQLPVHRHVERLKKICAPSGNPCDRKAKPLKLGRGSEVAFPNVEDEE